MKIQKLKPGEKPTLPAVRVLWDDDTEKQDFVSFAAAAKELKINPKTIPSAIKAGRDSFTRKSDGKKFTFEIPEENTPSRKKPKPLSEEEKAKRAEVKRQQAIKEKLEREVWKFYSDHVACMNPPSFKSQVEYLELFWPEQMAEIRVKLAPKEKPPAEKEPEPPQQPKEDPSEEEETHGEDPSEEEESSSAEEEEELSEEPLLQPPIPRPIPAPRKKVPAPRPIPAPRKKVPVIRPERRKFLYVPEPKPWEIKRPPPPTPPEVVEVIRAGKTFPFETSKKLEVTTFLSAARLARFIKSGCGRMFVQGPKKNQTLICNGQMVFLPDLVREIIVFHIRERMWKDEDGLAESPFCKACMEYNFQLKHKTTKNWIQAGFLRKVRELDDETIEQICKEFMKLLF